MLSYFYKIDRYFHNCMKAIMCVFSHSTYVKGFVKKFYKRKLHYSQKQTKHLKAMGIMSYESGFCRSLQTKSVGMKQIINCRNHVSQYKISESQDVQLLQRERLALCLYIQDKNGCEMNDWENMVPLQPLLWDKVLRSLRNS